MEKPTVSYADPNGKIDIRKLARHTKELSTKFSVNQDNYIGTISVSRGGTETILVAEDNAEVRAVTNEILTGAGYKILEAVDGEDAIHKFMENKDEINLLILDAIMPKKNGKEAYEAIKQTKPDVKAIFTSGYTTDIIYSKEVVKKGFDFLLKPFSPYVLLKKVRNALDKEE